jgi:hypothetical protein
MEHAAPISGPDGNLFSPEAVAPAIGLNSCSALFSSPLVRLHILRIGEPAPVLCKPSSRGPMPRVVVEQNNQAGSLSCKFATTPAGEEPFHHRHRELKNDRWAVDRKMMRAGVSRQLWACGMLCEQVWAKEEAATGGGAAIRSRLGEVWQVDPTSSSSASGQSRIKEDSPALPCAGCSHRSADTICRLVSLDIIRCFGVSSTSRPSSASLRAWR